LRAVSARLARLAGRCGGRPVVWGPPRRRGRRDGGVEHLTADGTNDQEETHRVRELPDRIRRP
jgi:hypothetical protein